MKRVLLALALLLATVSAAAQDYDVAVYGWNVTCGIDPPNTSHGLEFPPDAVEENTNLSTIAAAGGGRILGAVRGARIELVAIAPDRTRTPFFTGINGQRTLEMVVDAAGTVYVITAPSAAATPNTVLEISPAGTLVDTAPFPFEPASIDLAADQCTLFATDHTNRVRRHDVCANAPLTDFVTLPFGSIAGHVRILPDGGVLVTTGANEIRRYDPNGVLLRTYTHPYLNGPLALGSHGTTLLIGADCDRRIVEIDLVTGNVLREIPLQYVDRPFDIVSGRGFTAAIGPLAANDVPLAAPLTLMLIAVAVVFAAVWRMH